MSGAPITLTRLRSIFEGRAAPSSIRPDGVPAAVLVPFCGEDTDPQLVLTRRTRHVRHHKGEMAFPGGIRESGDPSYLATAIRETTEELGVAERRITVWGELDPVATTTGYELRAFVGELSLEDRPTLSVREVEEVVMIPLAWLLSPASKRDETRVESGKLSSRPTYSYNGNIVWGATARVLAGLIREIQCTAPAFENPGHEGSTATDFRQ